MTRNTSVCLLMLVHVNYFVYLLSVIKSWSFHVKRCYVKPLLFWLWNIKCHCLWCRVWCLFQCKYASLRRFTTFHYPCSLVSNEGSRGIIRACQVDKYLFHMFLSLWNEISLFHKLIYDIVQGSILIGWDVAVRLWCHR